MKLIKLYSHQSLITEPSDALTDLAAFLEITTDIIMNDDHVFIANNARPLSLESFPLRATTDVFVPNEVFCEVLMDIKAGMSVLEAYNKHGYTFN